MSKRGYISNNFYGRNGLENWNRYRAKQQSNSAEMLNIRRLNSIMKSLKHNVTTTSTEVQSKESVILYVSRYVDMKKLKQEIENCKKNNIAISLVLDTTANDLSDIYKDIDFIQAIIIEYGQVEMPIYCNIDNIMKNQMLNNSQKEEILKAYIDKMSKSNTYFGFYGTDTNLYNCNEYIINLTEYDCFLVQDSETIKYNGTSNMVKDLTGKVTLKRNLVEIITKKGLNKAENLQLTTIYTAKKGDTYHTVALRFGLSEDDLRDYNNCPKEELKEGYKVYIPNQYIQRNTEEVKEGMIRGIDISSWQTKIDWNRVKQTSDFVIVRIALDRANHTAKEGQYFPKAAEQIKNIVNNKLALGLYFCIVKDMDEKEYEERLEEYFIELEKDLAKNNISLIKNNIPIFLDFESYYSRNNYYGLMKVFEKVCNKHGFNKIGIYGNKSTLVPILSNLCDENGNRVNPNNTNWYIWRSGGSQYGNEAKDNPIPIEEIKEPTEDMLTLNLSNGIKVPVSIAQATNLGGNTGAANDKGHCDVDYCVNLAIFGNHFTRNKEEIETQAFTGVNFNEYYNEYIDQNVKPDTVAGIMVGTTSALIILGMIIKRKLKELEELEEPKVKKRIK